MRIALSPVLSHLDPSVQVARPDDVPTVDVTLFLIEEDAMWIDRAYRRLHPMFFRDEQQAERALRFFQRMNDPNIALADVGPWPGPSERPS